MLGHQPIWRENAPEFEMYPSGSFNFTKSPKSDKLSFMQLKYEAIIYALENCPPTHYASREFIAYRFVFENLANRNNFLPVLQVNPRRSIAPQFAGDQAKCLGYALSLFDSLAHAQKRYRQISQYNKNFHKTVGTYIAAGQIGLTDGVVSPVDEHGHITLHEFEQTKLASKFQIVAEADHVKKS